MLSPLELTVDLHIVLCLHKALRVLPLWQIIPVDADVVGDRNTALLQRQDSNKNTLLAPVWQMKLRFTESRLRQGILQASRDYRQ